MKNSVAQEQQKDLIDKGFDLDKRVNYALIAAGLGVAAVGAVMAAPAVVTFGAAVTGGSIGGVAVTENLRGGYESAKAKRAAKMGEAATKNDFRLAA